VADVQKPIHDLLPAPVYHAIERHLIRAGHRAEEGFSSGAEDEDTLTGDMLRPFRHQRTTPIPIDGQRWIWRVRTRKFAGHGEGATEHLVGADGIVQIEISSSRQVVLRKSILFQAKKNWRHRDGDLIHQATLMEAAAPLGSVVFNYASDRYTAVASNLLIHSSGRPTELPLKRLGEFLATDFLNCSVGRFDTYFNWDPEGLVLAGAEPSFYMLYPHFLVAIQVESEAKS